LVRERSHETLGVNAIRTFFSNGKMPPGLLPSAGVVALSAPYLEGG
jgi:hypothetical protein